MPFIAMMVREDNIARLYMLSVTCVVSFQLQQLAGAAGGHGVHAVELAMVEFDLVCVPAMEVTTAKAATSRNSPATHSPVQKVGLFHKAL